MDHSTELTQSAAARHRRGRFAAVLFLVGAPLMLVLASMLSGRRWYMLFALLMVTAALAPFFISFEKRRPRAREVVLIATMSALTVASHLFFGLLMPVQVGTAMVVISGVSLGSEAGVLVGSLSRLVINMYVGQGLWTLWQMFCWALLGFLAGLVFSRGGLLESKMPGEELPKERRLSEGVRVMMAPVMTILFAEIAGYISYVLFPGSDTTFFSWRVYAFGAAGLLAAPILIRGKLPVNGVTLSVFTFVTTFVLYGGIMNLSSKLISSASGFDMGSQSLTALYISGVPYDLLHAGSAAVCAAILGRSIISKLERIKVKYGIYK